MDFTTMGTIGSYIRQKNLTFAANYKIKTGQRITDSNGNLVSAKSSMFDQLVKAQKKSDEEVTAAKISNIRQKLRNGKKLSETEMNYLREKDPGLYKKAKHADDAREELKAELKTAKSKSEARQIVTRAMIKASAEASAELAAAKSAMSADGGVNPGGGEVEGAANTGESNLTGTEPQSLTEVNSEIAGAEENSGENSGEVAKIEIKAGQATAENLNELTKEISAATSENQAEEKNSPAGSNSNKTKCDDILEKFIMTIRALEDEWAQFAGSDEFKDLPEETLQAEKSKSKPKAGNSTARLPEYVLEIPSRQLSVAIAAYRSNFKF